eukprot:13104749-Alexandrium_andersonii.AAC.1
MTVSDESRPAASPSWVRALRRPCPSASPRAVWRAKVSPSPTVLAVSAFPAMPGCAGASPAPLPRASSRRALGRACLAGALGRAQHVGGGSGAMGSPGPLVYSCSGEPRP